MYKVLFLPWKQHLLGDEMIELTTAYELAKNFPSGVGGFFGSIVGGVITAVYLRRMLVQYLEKTLKIEKQVDKHENEILKIKAHLGI